MELTYDETVDMYDVKYIAGSTNGYTLTLGIYEITDINFMVNSSLLNKLKVNRKSNITIDDIRLQSILNTNKYIRFTKNHFFTALGFSQSLSRPLGDIDGFLQEIPGYYISDIPINIAGNDNVI